MTKMPEDTGTLDWVEELILEPWWKYIHPSIWERTPAILKELKDARITPIDETCYMTDAEIDARVARSAPSRKKDDRVPVTYVRPPLPARPCIICGEDFTPKQQPKARVCYKPECRKKRQVKRDAERVVNRKKKVQIPRPCLMCGNTFTPQRSNARMCSKTCQMRYSALKRVGKLPEELK